MTERNATFRDSPKQLLVQSGWVALGVLAAFVLYSWFVVPLLERNLQIVKPTRTFTSRSDQGTSQSNEAWSQWFPNGSWELDRCKVLMIAGGTILFQDYVPRDDGTLEVFPFTMIVQAESGAEPAAGYSPRSAPIILRASQRAILRFDRPFRLSGESAGKLKSGQLQGDVHIYRLAAEGASHEGFFVRTSNVQLAPTQISSLEDVEFQFGPHRGSGRNFRLDLNHDAPQTVSLEDFSRINGLRRLELAFVKAVQLHPSQAADAVAPDGRRHSYPTGPIQITCRGPFYFDFQAARGRFERDVWVQSLGATGDSIWGQTLEFEFDRVVPEQAERESSRTQWQRLSLRSVAVYGQPARVVLASQKTELIAEFVQYDVALEQVIASDSKRLTILQPGVFAQAQHIQYRMRSDQSLGPLVANGPGEIVQSSLERPDQPPRRIVWREQLTIEPAGQQRKITARGGVRFAIEGEYSVQGKAMEAWLWEEPKSPDRQERRWTYLPMAVEFTGDVDLASAKLAGTTEKLTLRWPLADQIPWSSTSSRNDLPYRAFRLPWSETQDGISPFPALPNSGAPAAAEPFPGTVVETVQAAPDQIRFAARRVQVWLDDSQTEWSVERVEMDGQVIIGRRHPAADGGEDWTIRGQWLRLTPQEGELYHIHARQQVHVQSPELDLAVSELFVDQRANRAWAPGSGDLHLRPRIRHTDRSAPPHPQQEVKLSWLGGIVFDGETVYVEHQVRMKMEQTAANATTTVVDASSTALSLVLSSPIHLAELQKPYQATRPGIADAPEAAIDRLTFVSQLPGGERAFPEPRDRGADPAAAERVIVTKSVLDSQRQPLEYQQLSVPRLVVHQREGRFQATGPGELTSWRMGSRHEGLMRQASSAGDRRSSSNITYLRVEYDSSLLGGDDFKHMAIQGRVRVLQAPAVAWYDRPRIDLQHLGAEVFYLTSDQVEVVQWTPRGHEEPHAEFIATGNARLRGETFEAVAQRLSYNQSTDILEIDGGDREEAQLRYQPDPRTRDRVQLAAQKIRYRPGDQWMEIVKARNATIQQNGR